MEDSFVIGLIQDRQASVKDSLQKIRETAQKGAQIICLKELFNSRYFCTAEEHQNFDLAEPIPGKTTDVLQKLAQELKVVIVAPMFEKKGPGVYHNSAAVIDADGALLGIYRKMHIPDDPLYYEKFYFAPGSEGFRVFKTKYGAISVLICWDQWFPEAARICALMGAEVIFYPTAIGWHPKEKNEFGAAQVAAWQTIQRSHAIANGVYVVAVNRVGHEETVGTDGIEFFGHSFVCDPFGRIMQEADQKETILVVQCSRKHLEDTRRHWPFLRDRRIDAYSAILNRYLG